MLCHFKNIISFRGNMRHTNKLLLLNFKEQYMFVLIQIAFLILRSDSSRCNSSKKHKKSTPYIQNICSNKDTAKKCFLLKCSF